MIHFQRTRNLLREFKFQDVFRELGWANPPKIPAPEFQVDGARYRFTPIAEQGGLHAFEVSDLTDGGIPTRAAQLALKRQLTPLFAEHFLVFVNRARSSSLWLWVRRDGDTRKPVDCRFDRIQSGELLLQKLSGLHFDYDDLDDDGKASIGQVLDRLNANFYAEKVTKRFYEEFRTYKDRFIKFIEGIESLDNQKWYASVILNRLMFIYFIQQKRFLSNDPEYLQNKFDHCEDNDLNYYRDFLCPLFFQGFALRSEDRSAATNDLLGTVPYLDGGLFLEHPHLEADGKLAKIRIENAAFKRLLAFFGEYNWHLDERPLRQGNEINPDVLGYIFEKYVNQKQMGAYYTKEDITEYISTNTIIPFIFDAAVRKCPAAFKGDSAIWKLLQLDPDRYIYDAVKKGVEIPLPKEIEAGIKDVSKRDGWNKPAKEEFALPTEIWREVVARRQRYAEVRGKLANGEVRDNNDLVTLNLNLRQFIVDVILDCRDPELLTAIYYTIAGRVPDPEKQSNQEIQPALSVLDITCGSGAFLFAALNILEPIYEACLSKMQEFVDSAGDSKKFSHFRRILDDVRSPEHSNARYFILKTIIVNNLFGVDIMEEAVEICKLRLFLKLAAQVDADPKKENLGIEPLPDIDFNIRAGNSLVGYATRAEVEKSAESDMLRKMALPKILEDAEITDRAFKLFRQLQTRSGATAQERAQAKSGLQQRLTALEYQLNCFLAEDYQLGLSKKRNAFEAWLKSHQPFHWFVEFYGIVSGGGFDVIIGNPPFVENTPSKVPYALKRQSYSTLDCGNLYAFVSERSCGLCNKGGAFSLIMPAASICTPRMHPLESVIRQRFQMTWTSVWDERPSKLFDGVDQQLTIHIGRGCGPIKRACITAMRHWATEERDHLFATLTYLGIAPSQRVADVSPKIACDEELGLLTKILTVPHVLSGGLMVGTGGTIIFYRNAGGRYWRLVKSFPTFFRSDAGATATSTEKTFRVGKEHGSLFVALFSSSLFYWFWRVCSNCRHLTDRELTVFPVAKSTLENRNVDELNKLAMRFESCLKENKRRQTTENKRSGTVVQDIYFVSAAKSILDEIDRVLARHYSFTEEELDFILNYDIKYRLGRDTESDDE